MAKIFTISKETSTPEWFVNQPAQPTKFAGTTTDADRIASLPATLTEDAFTSELDVIEKCASTNSSYFYNANWDQDITGRLQEFAAAYNVKAFAANPSDPLVLAAKTQTTEVVKTASVATAKIQPIAISDAFQLESKGNMDHMKKVSNWNQPTAESKVVNPNIFMTAGAVIRMGGNEDTRIHSHLKAIPGQNSVTNPDAIKDLATQVDTGVRLRQEAKDRTEQRQAVGKSWETEVAQAGKVAGAAAKSNIIPAAAAPASGKAFGSLHLDAVPAKTTGEQFKSQSDARRAGIQRSVETEHAWDGLQGTTKAKVGDLLLAGLEERLMKIASTKKEAMTFGPVANCPSCGIVHATAVPNPNGITSYVCPKCKAAITPEPTPQTGVPVNQGAQPKVPTVANANNELKKEAFLSVGRPTGKCPRCGKTIGKIPGDVNLPPLHLLPDGQVDTASEAACKPGAVPAAPTVNLPKNPVAANPAKGPVVNLPASHAGTKQEIKKA